LHPIVPTLNLHARTLLHLSRKAAIAAIADASRRNALTDDAILAIVMAAAAAEAFINEFAEYVSLSVASSSGSDMIQPQIAACADVLQELEDSRASVTAKYLAASLVVAGKSFPKGASPFQDFKLLIDLRNAIMHVHPTVGNDAHQGQRATDALAQRGIAIAGGQPGSLPWFDRLMMPSVAVWAHDSALAIIRGFLDLVPMRPYYDPLGTYRESFRMHPSIPDGQEPAP
jgi:hypothetical protein